jgi:choice-of-anchor A domain-containing protein
MSTIKSQRVSLLVVGVVLSACGLACRSNDVQIVDLHSDFRDIWAGRETPETGKQAEPDVPVVVDFSTTVDPARVTAQFLPVDNNKPCGSAIAATAFGSFIAPNIWGKVTSSSARPSVPAPYNLFARKSISGAVNAEGAIAAGGDVTLANFSVSARTAQPVGLIAGGKVTLANGSVHGNLTFGATSAFPQTVRISGTESQQPFDVETAFQDLETLARLLNEAPATGSAISSHGKLQLTGKRSGLNVFQVSADTLKQATSVQITVPSGAGALVNLSGGSVSIQNKGLSLQGTTATRVLWNLPDARLVQISSVDLQGSLLAPGAWLSFESGNINGTVVVQDFASSGSGSLHSAPLNRSIMLAASLPSAVALRPAQALVSGCSYGFIISSPALTANGKRLSKSPIVTFKVAGAHSTRLVRELTGVHSDGALKTVSAFQARPGINTPVSDIWSRYASVIGSPTLVAVGTPRPDPLLAGQMLTYYQQFHQGYPVADYGYLVSTEGGVFRKAHGGLAGSLPRTLPTPISEAAALQAALQYLKIQTPPWVTAPAKNSPPTMALALVSQAIDPINADDVKLLWEVGLVGSGVLDPVGIEVDAASGKVVGTFPGMSH